MIAIVGLGLMGGSLALALRRAHPGLELVGIDSDPEALRRALASGAIDAAGDDLALASGAEVVFLAVPVTAMRVLLPQLPKASLITDLGSTKVEVGAWAVAAGLRFVGGHPMCGSERSGFAAAHADLYQGATWVLTEAEERLEELVTSVGAHILSLDPADHDRLVAGVSHTAFFLSAAYLLALAGSPDWRVMQQLAGAGFRDMTRLAGGSPEMYAAIAATNAVNLAAWLETVESALARLRRHLQADGPRLGELFEEAKEVRRRWLEPGGSGGAHGP